MKAKTLLLTLSIFLTAYICNAQDYNKKGDFSLCDKKPGEISKAELLQVLNSDCRAINLFAEDGNQLNVVEFTFAFTPPAKGSAYFENVNSENLTGSIKKKIELAEPGTMIVFANIICMVDNKRVVYDGGMFTIVE